MGSGWDLLNKKMMWCTRGSNCSICDSMAGRVYTFDRWQSAGVFPGFHLNCNCYLKTVEFDTPESDLDIFGGMDNEFMLQSKWFFTIFDLDTFRTDVPYNYRMTRAIEKTMVETGLPIAQAMKSMTDRTIGDGGIFNKPRFYIHKNFFQWRVHRTLRVNSGANDSLWSDLSVRTKTLRPYFPWQTHRYFYYRGGSFP